MEIPEIQNHQKRVIIAGAGFAGLTLAKKLSEKYFQVVLIDKNNYHQFQPLLYQVAMAGLEPSSISFPLRKIFQHKPNVFIRIAEVISVNAEHRFVETTVGSLHYDYLVLANGAATNFFGLKDLEQNAFSMKSVSEALLLRNTLLQHYEKAVIEVNETERAALLNIVIVGGGPTGVELAGALAEMKNKILPKDYPEINFREMKIYLMEAAPKLLGAMSESSSEKVKQYLVQLGVEVQTATTVKNYDGYTVVLGNGTQINSRCLIWAAGVKAASMKGIDAALLAHNGRIVVNEFNMVTGYENVFAIGDVALMCTTEFPKGHPQVAPVAIQQANLLSKNLKNIALNKALKPFKYIDKGSMATVGRNLAVAEAAGLKLKGFIAWSVWMLVHLMSIIGVKNRIFVLINWVWQYVTYDQSLRLIIKPSEKNKSLLPELTSNHKINKPIMA